MFRQYLVLSLTFLLFSCSFGQKKMIHYTKSFEQAQKISQKENKSTLLIFSGTDWCRPCMIFDQTILSDEKFISFAEENLIIYKASFPRRKKNNLSDEKKAYNEKLASTYNNTGAFPNLLLFDKNSDTYHILSYNLTTEAFIQQIKKIQNNEKHP